MMLALLSLLTLTVVLLPMWPAFSEWRHPTDIEPLSINENDALDPPHLARQFAAQLQNTLAAGEPQFKGKELVTFRAASAYRPMPFTGLESGANESQRVWHVQGSLQLPEHMNFLGEVAATQDLHTAAHGVYGALWSGGVVRLARHSAVKQWVHGREVRVQADANTGSRTTADERIRLAPGVQFLLLHAPSIETTWSTAPAQLRLEARRAMPTWPADMAWDQARRRGYTAKSLAIEALHIWHADLVSMGDLQIGADCEIHGNLKAHGKLRLQRGCQVYGSVFAQGAIYLEDDCVVTGAVVSEAAVHVHERCRIGAPLSPATVTAPLVRLSAGVRVHGTVWANRQGEVVGHSEPYSTAFEQIFLGGTPA